MTLNDVILQMYRSILSPTYLPPGHGVGIGCPRAKIFDQIPYPRATIFRQIPQSRENINQKTAYFY